MFLPLPPHRSRPHRSRYAPALVTPPAGAPVTLAQAKAHCNAADFTDDDAQLQAFINAAVSYLDGYSGTLGRCLEQQTWRQDFDCFDSELRIPLAPAIALGSVKYDDQAGVLQTVDPASYQLLVDAGGPFVRFKQSFTLPSASSESPAVHVTFDAGYAPTNATPAVSTVPAAIKSAILLIVGHLYENRAAVVAGPTITIAELPLGAMMLLAPFRRAQI